MGGLPWEEAAITQNRGTHAIEATRLIEEAGGREAEATVTPDQAQGHIVIVMTTVMMTEDLTIPDDQSEAKEAADTRVKVERAIDRDRT